MRCLRSLEENRRGGDTGSDEAEDRSSLELLRFLDG